MWEVWSKEVPVAEFEAVVEWLRANGCPEEEEMTDDDDDGWESDPE
jgi:hypothetical protein